MVNPWSLKLNLKNLDLILSEGSDAYAFVKIAMVDEAEPNGIMSGRTPFVSMRAHDGIHAGTLVFKLRQALTFWASLRTLSGGE